MVTLGREFIPNFEFSSQVSHCLFSSARRTTKNPTALWQLPIQPFSHASRLSMAFVRQLATHIVVAGFGIQRVSVSPKNEIQSDPQKMFFVTPRHVRDFHNHGQVGRVEVWVPSGCTHDFGTQSQITLDQCWRFGVGQGHLQSDGKG